MDYLDLWWHDQLAACQRSKPIVSGEAWGRFKRNVGGGRFGAVRLRIEPADAFSIGHEPDQQLTLALSQLDGYRMIAFGVIDELMRQNVCNVRVTILEILTHPVESVPIGYRMAAREAVKEILSKSE